MKKRLFIYLVTVLLMATISSTIHEVEAIHTSSVTVKAIELSALVTPKPKWQLWIYTYNVTNKVGPSSIFRITIDKSATAFVVMLPKANWTLYDDILWMRIESSSPLQFNIRPGTSKIFTICSRQNPIPGTALTIDTMMSSSGPHAVDGPDNKTEDTGEVQPEGSVTGPNTYTYTLTWISGYADYFWLALEPGVIVENVIMSNPGWSWHRFTEEGLLLFNTTTNPINATNTEVSMTFSSPNSIEGEVGALTAGFGDYVLGPVLPLPVGGVWVPVDKFALLVPYVALASTIIVATAVTAIYVKRRKKKQ